MNDKQNYFIENFWHKTHKLHGPSLGPWRSWPAPAGEAWLNRWTMNLGWWWVLVRRAQGTMKVQFMKRGRTLGRDWMDEMKWEVAGEAGLQWTVWMLQPWLGCTSFQSSLSHSEVHMLGLACSFTDILHLKMPGSCKEIEHSVRCTDELAVVSLRSLQWITMATRFSNHPCSIIHFSALHLYAQCVPNTYSFAKIWLQVVALRVVFL